jgi:hypothetical protein
MLYSVIIFSIGAVTLGIAVIIWSVKVLGDDEGDRDILALSYLVGCSTAFWVILLLIGIFSLGIRAEWWNW